MLRSCCCLHLVACGAAGRVTQNLDVGIYRRCGLSATQAICLAESAGAHAPLRDLNRAAWRDVLDQPLDPHFVIHIYQWRKLFH